MLFLQLPGLFLKLSSFLFRLLGHAHLGQELKKDSEECLIHERLQEIKENCCAYALHYSAK